MRVRSHRVQQATGHPGTAAVAVAMVVTRLMVVIVLMIVIVLTVVTVLMIVTVPMMVTVVRAARAVHVSQHARETALPHINTYQGRALAN
jgi:1,4-dihydroxy-2-naphthoate octaprenyltransferase